MFFRSGQTFEDCPLMPPEERTVDKNQRENKIAKQPVKNPAYRRGIDGNHTMDKDGPTTTAHYHIEIATPFMTKELHEHWLLRVWNGHKVRYTKRRDSLWPWEMSFYECIIKTHLLRNIYKSRIRKQGEACYIRTYEIRKIQKQLY